MTYETETKVLNVDKEEVVCTLEKLGASKILDTRFVVDWFWTPGTEEGKEPWYLRIRSTRQGICEITWKGKSSPLGASRSHQEINITVSSHQAAADFLQAIGLQLYAHQEKDRTSWTHKDWKFDLDQCPGMPAYLEIEGKSEAHIQEALKLLGLEKNVTSSEGERILIQKTFGLDWYTMKF